MAKQLTAEDRWLVAQEKLLDLITFLRDGEVREEWMLLAILLTVRGGCSNQSSFERLREWLEAYTKSELEILNAPNN